MIPTEEELNAPLVRLIRSLSETMKDIVDGAVIAIFGLVAIFWAGMAGGGL